MTPGDAPAIDAVSGVDTSAAVSDLFRVEKVVGIDAVLEEAGRLEVWIEAGFWARGGNLGSAGGGANVKPVRREEILRSAEERQRTVRDTLAGRECQVNIRVPAARTTRREVIMWVG